MKRKMKLTVPGKPGYIPSVDGDDLVRDSGKVASSGDVTNWLLTRLGQIHDQAKDLINQHLATLSLINGQSA